MAKNSEVAMRDALMAGKESAWRTIFAQYGPSLLAYGIRMLGDRNSAEEILQDSLVNIYQTIDKFQGQCSLKSWLYRVVHNRCIDELRRRKHFIKVTPDQLADYFDDNGRWQQECPGWDGLAAKLVDERRLLDRVSRELRRLPHSHREMLLLKEVVGLDSSEICAALDINPGNLRIRLHRARVALRKAVVEDIL